MVGYIALYPLASVQWARMDVAQTKASGCLCCESGCACSSKPGGCQTMGVSKGVAVSLKGLSCQTEPEKKLGLMSAFRWFLVPELQRLDYTSQWRDLLFREQKRMCLGQARGVLDKPPRSFAQQS